jgi:ribosome-associated translation inhibitor RaiA
MTKSPTQSPLPKGFLLAATACGLKKTGALDLAIADLETRLNKKASKTGAKP